MASKPKISPKSKRSDQPSRHVDVGIPRIGNYEFTKTLGEGNFAKVKLARHILTKIEVAIKIIYKGDISPVRLSKLTREVNMMKLLNHPNIIKLYEVIEEYDRIFLVMEYASRGELYDYIVAHGKFSEDEARVKFRQILSAVSYCHDKKIIHRDLKAENLLLDENLNIKIADFGFSSLYDPDNQLETFCGSPPYAAPELFNGFKYVGPELDIWSLGVILYVLITGCLPFHGKTLQEMRESVCKGKYRVPFYLSDSCEMLLRKFLTRNPKKRYGLEVILDDPWITSGAEKNFLNFQESQTSINLDMSIVEEIESKYEIPKELVLKEIEENAYKEAQGLYYLLYYQKLSRKKTEENFQLPSPTNDYAKGSAYSKHPIDIPEPPTPDPEPLNQNTVPVNYKRSSDVQADRFREFSKRLTPSNYKKSNPKKNAALVPIVPLKIEVSAKYNRLKTNQISETPLTSIAKGEETSIVPELLCERYTNPLPRFGNKPSTDLKNARACSLNREDISPSNAKISPNTNLSNANKNFSKTEKNIQNSTDYGKGSRNTVKRITGFFGDIFRGISGKRDGRSTIAGTPEMEPTQGRIKPFNQKARPRALDIMDRF